MFKGLPSGKFTFRKDVVKRWVDLLIQANPYYAQHVHPGYRSDRDSYLSEKHSSVEKTVSNIVKSAVEEAAANAKTTSYAANQYDQLGSDVTRPEGDADRDEELRNDLPFVLVANEERRIQPPGDQGSPSSLNAATLRKTARVLGIQRDSIPINEYTGMHKIMLGKMKNRAGKKKRGNFTLDLSVLHFLFFFSPFPLVIFPPFLQVPFQRCFSGVKASMKMNRWA